MGKFMDARKNVKKKAKTSAKQKRQAKRAKASKMQRY